MEKYTLFHKDIPCGKVEIDEQFSTVLSYKNIDNTASPYLGTADLLKIKKWWQMRAIPGSRSDIQYMLRKAGCSCTEEYLAKNLAVSVTDCYWICPENMNLKYDDVKFSNYKFINDGKIPYHNATSYSPNASLGGQMDKYWDFTNDTPVLVKESSKYFGQQSINEAIATYIHELQGTDIPYVKYSLEFTEDNSVLCKCSSFTSEQVEFISTYEVLGSAKKPNDISLYDFYIDLCVKNGIARELMQDFMDYQTMTDFVISNTDEHLQNFGILRDADTLNFLGPAPIFDSGNSMYYDEHRKVPYSEEELLQREITSFYKTEDKMLQKVKNKNIVKADLLPSPDEIKNKYIENNIPEQKAEFISKNYETKVHMVRELQKGKMFSLYSV